MNLYGMEHLTGAAFHEAKAHRAELLEDAACHQQRAHRLTAREGVEMRRAFDALRVGSCVARFRGFRHKLRDAHYARLARMEEARQEARRLALAKRDARRRYSTANQYAVLTVGG